MFSETNGDTSQSLQSQLTTIFDKAGCSACLCALDIESNLAVNLNPHQNVVAASVFKVVVGLELFRRAALGDLDATTQVTIRQNDITPGPTGLSNFQDSASLSLRDLASLMLSISDNTATDILINQLGLANLNKTLQKLGLHKTVIEIDLKGLINSIIDDANVSNLNELWTLSEEERDKRLARCRALQPDKTNRTTSYEMAHLLQSIWKDEAASAQACAEVRQLMSQQTSYRLALGFPDEVRVHAKSGSLMGRIRNEIGVMTYPDQRSYAVAVFTISHRGNSRQNAIDRAMGEAAAIAISALRTES